MNRVSLVGRITKDPEVRYSQTGSAVLAFTIAVDRALRDANGQRQADFISCVAFGTTADFISRYIKKGFMLAVCGRLQSRSYQGTDGQTRYVTEVICDSVENLTPRDPNAQPQYNENPQYQPRPQYQPNNQYQANNQYQGYNNPQYQQQDVNYGRAQNLNSQAQPESFDGIKAALLAVKPELEFETASCDLVPSTYVDLDEDHLGKFKRLLEALAEYDDVDEVIHNANLPAEEE